MNKKIFIQSVWRKSQWPEIQKFLSTKSPGRSFQEIAVIEPTSKQMVNHQNIGICGVKKKR